jgi:hypothetical protein
MLLTPYVNERLIVVRQFTVASYYAISLPTKIATHSDNPRIPTVHKESANTGTSNCYSGGSEAYHFETNYQYEREGPLSLAGTGDRRNMER